MEVKPGYKQTEVGVIPEEWEVKRLGAVLTRLANGALYRPSSDTGLPVTRIETIADGTIDMSRVGYGTRTPELEEYRMRQGDILFSHINSVDHIGKVAFYGGQPPLYHGMNLLLLRAGSSLDCEYLFYWLGSHQGRKKAVSLARQAVSQASINTTDLKRVEIPIPPLPEQRAIAEALSDVDGLLDGLDRLIAKKRDLKQAAMQQLLTGQTRLPGFHGEWEVKALGEITDSLDNLRVPLNESQRERMKGEYPYCGANGVLGFVDNYVVDDDIILMAEDGGYFDEYETRPIAYRMTGKCWVNNHAHILKAKPGFDQGFLFYSLVHKNILPFLASGTRAKLNKSEMNKIEVRRPKDHPEQTAIALVLSEMDGELAVLEQRREKTRALKQAMMQELLTGRTRLVGRSDGSDRSVGSV